MVSLYPYQDADSDHCAGRRSTYVGHQPRVGKTPIAIATANKMGAKLVLCVVPANTVENWKRDIGRFGNGKWTAVVVSWAMVVKLLPKWHRAKFKPDLVVIDEAHFAKSRQAGRTKAVLGSSFDGSYSLIENAQKVLLLSGTPMPSDPSELWPILRAAAPELIDRGGGKPMSYSMFCSRYVKKVRTPFGMKTVGAKNVKELRDSLYDSGFLIRRTRREVFGRDLRPPIKSFLKLPTEYAGRLKLLQSSAGGKAMLKALNEGGLKALRKVSDPDAGALRQLFGMAKVPGVIDLVEEELASDPTAKVVVFAWHVEVVKALTAGLKKHGALAYYGGSGSREDKARINREFLTNASKRVVVCQIIAAAVGLDFSVANLAVFAEMSYVGTDNEQAQARIFHPESVEPKDVLRAVLKGTLDEAIIAAADGRLKVAASLFD